MTKKFRENPVGVAQQTVLDALEMKAGSFQDANRQFSALGIVVNAKRQGRTSVPVITEAEQGRWNRMPGGDYDGPSAVKISADIRGRLAQWWAE